MKIYRPLIVLLLISGCALFSAKPTRYSPLKSFYKMKPSHRAAAALKLIEEGRSLFFNQEIPQATEYLNRAIVIDPTNPFAYYFLSLISYEQRDYRKSIGFLTKAKHHAKPFLFWNAHIHFLFALNWKRLGNQKRYTFYLKRAQKLGPTIDFTETD